MPEIHGGHTLDQIKQDVLNLHQISLKLRQGRFEKGVLSLKQPKLYFKTDGDGLPISCAIYPMKASNRLIEEYMLLANMMVAERIYEMFVHFPSCFFLSIF